VRLATESNLDAVERLLGDCIAAMRQAGIDQWDEIYPGRQTVLSDVRAGTVFLAFRDEHTLLGSLVLNETQSPEWAPVQWEHSSARIVVVHRLMVDPKFQGAGIARELMRFAEDWARGHGYGAVRLDAFVANPRALSLYRGLGYRDAGGASLRKGPFRCFEKRLEPGTGATADGQ
jgi:GNAT superfamily N-acetyltransferase